MGSVIIDCESNTITGWVVKELPNVDWKHAVNLPRSMVTDPRSNYAGTLISVYVTNERVELDQGSELEGLSWKRLKR